jgi:hypothetical protein
VSLLAGLPDEMVENTKEIWRFRTTLFYPGFPADTYPHALN